MNPTQIAFPWDFDEQGRTSTVDDDRHLRDMIEQVLFTTPGERVNRPDFGSGVLQLVFAPNSSLVASAVQSTTKAALEAWLGDLLEIQDLEVVSEDAALRVDIAYVARRTGQAGTATFTRGGAQ
jgi:phage baseplate assembly protein W